MSKFSLCLFLAIVPAFGQSGGLPDWNQRNRDGRDLDDNDSRSLFRTPSSRFPRAEVDPGWMADSLVPRANPPLGTAAGKISAQALQHPPSKKESNVLRKAQKFSEAGDHAQAAEILRAAAKDREAYPYLHSRLGTEYLRCARPDLAIPELETAVRLMPGESLHHSNLAYAYRLIRQFARGEQEARIALDLDHTSAPAHFLLGAILIAEGGRLDEAIDNFKLARNTVASARLGLAQAYAAAGMPEASRRELAGYLAVSSGAERAAAEKWFAVSTRSLAPAAKE